MKHWTEKLSKLKACPESVEWARAYPTMEAAWAECERGDWMLWLVGRVSGAPGSESRRLVARAAAACARLALPAWKAKYPEDTTVEAVILAAERGDPEECRKAASASSSWASSASSAAEAAEATWAAAWASESAAWAAAWASRIKRLAECAEIVRGFYPVPPAMA